jgi:predicted dehydrogenase
MSVTQTEVASPVGIALVGCGRISTSHLRAIESQPQFGRLIAVVDSDLERAQEVAAAYGAAHAVAELRDVLQVDDVEAVCLCTPNEVHEEQALLALSAGRHVLVEKPMAESEAGAARMVEAADRSDLVLAAAHTFRHGEAVRYLQDHRADYGRLRAVQISMCVHWNGPQAPWWKDRTPEQGLILSLLAPHALDFLQVALGEWDPLRVSVESTRHQSGWSAEDEAMILLRYPNDCLAFVHLSYNQPWVLDRKTLHFERALVRIEDGDRLWVNDELRVGSAPTDEANLHRMGVRDHSHYFHRQLEEFARAVRGLENRSVRPRDAQRTTALMHRVLRAANANSISGHGGTGAQQ